MPRQNYKPELSRKSMYHISKHRYLELKHFCLQYEEWRKRLEELYPGAKGLVNSERVQVSGVEDSTASLAIRRSSLQTKLEAVEQAAIKTDPDLYSYILEAVTTGVTYEYLQTIKNIPCCRNTFYDRYRKFFYILSAIKD